MRLHACHVQPLISSFILIKMPEDLEVRKFPASEIAKAKIIPLYFSDVGNFPTSGNPDFGLLQAGFYRLLRISEVRKYFFS